MVIKELADCHAAIRYINTLLYTELRAHDEKV